MKPSAWIDDALADVPALATADEVRAVLRLSRRHLYRLLAAGKLHAVKMGVGSSRVLIPRSALRDFLANMEAAA